MAYGLLRMVYCVWSKGLWRIAYALTMDYGVRTSGVNGGADSTKLVRDETPGPVVRSEHPPRLKQISSSGKSYKTRQRHHKQGKIRHITSRLVYQVIEEHIHVPVSK